MSTASTTPQQSTDPMIGRLVDHRYRLHKCIGRGGGGVVYLARDCDSLRTVVLKFLAESLTGDDAAVARFHREARRLASARHDNIVTMLGHGKDGDRYFLVMEHIEGQQLDTFVESRQGRLPLHEFVPIAAQILKAVGYAHAREIVLRDVKSSNIMLCERKGRRLFVKLLDFGLAKSLRQDVTVTEDHVVGGTVGYLAPEVLEGAAPDLRADVYSLGVLFFEMLAGRMPFLGETASAILYKTVHEAAPSLAEVMGEGVLPAGLVGLVDASLGKHPSDRPADANELVEGLIDVVPAGLFRLPAVNPANPLPGRIGNTGLFSLVGGAGDAPSPAASQVSPIPPMDSVSPRTSPRAPWTRAAGVALLLGAGVLTWYLTQPDAGPDERPSTTAAVQASALQPSPPDHDVPSTELSPKVEASIQTNAEGAETFDTQRAPAVQPADRTVRRNAVAHRRRSPSPDRPRFPAAEADEATTPPAGAPPTVPAQATGPAPSEPLPELKESTKPDPLATPVRENDNNDDLLRPAARQSSSDALLPSRDR